MSQFFSDNLSYVFTLIEYTHGSGRHVLGMDEAIMSVRLIAVFLQVLQVIAGRRCAGGRSSEQTAHMADQPMVSGADQQQWQHMQQSAVSQQLCLQHDGGHLQQHMPQVSIDSRQNVHNGDSSGSSSSRSHLQEQAHGLLLNGLRLLELATQLQDYAAQAAAAAEVAQQYESARRCPPVLRSNMPSALLPVVLRVPLV